MPPNAPLELRVARLERRNKKLTALLDVAKALTAERNLDSLLEIILRESVRTVDAERGSLFIVGRDRKQLWSKIAHGLSSEIIRMPIGTGIAGHVAATGRLLNIPDAYADGRFNAAVDTLTGYRTRSILCVPMLGTTGQVVGVVQALNHSSGPFTEEDEELLMALGANAAAAIENANLYEDIEKLFDGLVKAAVTAIESRDPTTSGHSGRVAELSCTLLQSLTRSSGPYKTATFNNRELREMRYAALLHDFGKVGVRENVLLKAAKLYPHELELLEARFEYARASHERRFLTLRLGALERGGDTQTLRTIEEEWKKIDSDLDEMLAFIRKCNQPTVLEQGGFERLADLAKLSFVDRLGREHKLLRPEEHKNLAIPRGSLNEEERREIERHVAWTYEFLRQIPWTQDLSRVPEFAHGHHEKLDGTGYPRRIDAGEIAIQTRVMTICDIYDALTAADRPYKAAMPHDRAIDILAGEARRGKIDQALLDVFIESRVPHHALGL